VIVEDNFMYFQELKVGALESYLRANEPGFVRMRKSTRVWWFYKPPVPPRPAKMNVRPSEDTSDLVACTCSNVRIKLSGVIASW
jgi:hypothetical protein